MADAPLRLGVIGLGRAFTLMLSTFLDHPRIALVAAFDPRSDAVARFVAEFAAAGYDTAEALCADPSVQAVYVASPHEFHSQHVKLAAASGKHILVEKPMALSINDAAEMVEAARRAGVHLLVGHSHSYDLPYLRAREMIASGAFGRVRMINALNFTDFLYRPRRPEELDASAGGGVVPSQAAHQVDVVRLLATSKATSVRAVTGSWDAARGTEGAYNAQLRFEDGAFASLTYSGYARFDTDEFNDWLGEMGQTRDPDDYGQARRQLATIGSVAEEIAMKNRRTYGPSGADAFRAPAPPAHNHFGLVVVSCEHADLRPTARGVIVYANSERRFEELPKPDIARAEVVDELYDAAIRNRRPLHSGAWGLATLEACLAIRQSSADGAEVRLHHQV
jgi:phthalate 4,5-cis-dihydrodiol dehydrogenase